MSTDASSALSGVNHADHLGRHHLICWTPERFWELIPCWPDLKGKHNGTAGNPLKPRKDGAHFISGHNVQQTQTSRKHVRIHGSLDVML